MADVLHIFNPDTDYALAVGNLHFTPSAKIIEVAAKYALLPALWALENDFILIPEDYCSFENDNPFLRVLHEKNIRYVKPSELKDCRFTAIKPWGWNYTLRDFLLNNHIDATLLPSVEDINCLRNLSHRRLCIPFNIFLRDNYKNNYFTPYDNSELKTGEEVCKFIEKHDFAVFKAPWSSSGRGIVFSKNFTPQLLDEWIFGIFRKQGSVMAEIENEKILDFATEWICHDGKANFLGFSVFETSSRGKYVKNINGSQSDLIEIIKSKTPFWSTDIIDIQKSALEKFVCPAYSGPAGIDMLIDKFHRINPCVEINLRMTMGHAAIYAYNNGIQL